MSVIKNFILIGDVYQSVQFVTWSERGRQLQPLSRDKEPLSTACTNFILDDGALRLVASDSDGNLLVFKFDPASTNSDALECSADIHLGSCAAAMLRCPMMDNSRVASAHVACPAEDSAVQRHRTALVYVPPLHASH